MIHGSFPLSIVFLFLGFKLVLNLLFVLHASPVLLHADCRRLVRVLHGVWGVMVRCRGTDWRLHPEEPPDWTVVVEYVIALKNGIQRQILIPAASNIQVIIDRGHLDLGLMSQQNPF